MESLLRRVAAGHLIEREHWHSAAVSEAPRDYVLHFNDIQENYQQENNTSKQSILRARNFHASTSHTRPEPQTSAGFIRLQSSHKHAL